MASAELREKLATATANHAILKKTPKARSKTMSSVGLWEELETVYKDMDQREKDYQIAVEIGKMLVEKNKELEEKNDELQQQFTQALHERENEMHELQTRLTKTNMRKEELKTKVQQLEMQVKLLQTGKGDSEFKALLLSDEFSKMEDKLEKYKKQIRAFKSRGKDLSEEVEKVKGELEVSKKTETVLRKQNDRLKEVQNLQHRIEPETSEEEQHIREKLEKELTDLAVAKSRLEGVLKEVTTENIKLKEIVTQKEEEKAQVVKQVASLHDVNQRLVRQEKEERALLQEKEQELQMLQQRIEERELFPMNAAVVTLAQELASSSPSYSKAKGKSLKISQFEEATDPAKDAAEDTEWRNRLTELQRKHEVMKQKEEILLKENYTEKMDKQSLMTELKEMRTQKAKSHEFLAAVYELRERLLDSEIKNLTRAMRNVRSFEDIISNSQHIIDSVEKDVQKKAGDKQQDTEIGLIAELLVEICRLKRSANDYVEALNRATMEKLERFNQQWPKVESLKPKKSLWTYFPLFDFFQK